MGTCVPKKFTSKSRQVQSKENKGQRGKIRASATVFSSFYYFFKMQRWFDESKTDFEAGVCTMFHVRDNNIRCLVWGTPLLFSNIF